MDTYTMLRAYCHTIGKVHRFQPLMHGRMRWLTHKRHFPWRGPPLGRCLWEYRFWTSVCVGRATMSCQKVLNSFYIQSCPPVDLILIMGINLASDKAIVIHQIASWPNTNFPFLSTVHIFTLFKPAQTGLRRTGLDSEGNECSSQLFKRIRPTVHEGKKKPNSLIIQRRC